MAVSAAAVVATAALAAAVLGSGDADETADDRAALPEVTTKASLNIAVSEAPSPPLPRDPRTDVVVTDTAPDALRPPSSSTTAATPPHRLRRPRRSPARRP